MDVAVAAVYYASTLITLYLKKFIGHPNHTLWGVDKLLLSILIGSVATLAIGELYEHMKRRNDNHAHFPFQKIVMPVVLLLILSGIFYYITKNTGHMANSI